MSLAGAWSEVLPSEAVRERGERLLSVHPLRAADAFQLAAALVWSRGATTTHAVVSFDERLRDAAHREGFPGPSRVSAVHRGAADGPANNWPDRSGGSRRPNRPTSKRCDTLPPPSTSGVLGDRLGEGNQEHRRQGGDGDRPAAPNETDRNDVRATISCHW
ncbi:MAG: hypothetical protein U0802_02130 [Candidatus Binatia bacterium]